MDATKRSPFFPAGVEPTVVETQVSIDCAPAAVFNYVTAPHLWHTWHPATRSVSGVPSRPLVTGESMHEKIRIGFRRLETDWIVDVCEPPERWVISAQTHKGRARISYDVTAQSGGTCFTRALEYCSAWPFRALDGNFMRWSLEVQSRRALDALKRVLEGASLIEAHSGGLPVEDEWRRGRAAAKLA